MPTRTAFEDVRTIHNVGWRLGSARPFHDFEDVVVGNLGHISHETAVLKIGADREPEPLSCGEQFALQIGWSTDRPALACRQWQLQLSVAIWRGAGLRDARPTGISFRLFRTE